MKKFLAFLVTIFIILLWVITLTGVGGIGPIADRTKLGLDLSGGVYVVMEAQTEAEGQELSDLMKQTQIVIEKRVNEMGLSEPIVTIEGENRIRVELPGAEDPEEAIREIGKTAQLRFLLADGSLVLDGSMVKDAGVAIDQQDGGYVVTLEFDAAGAEAFAEGTRTAFAGTVAPAIEGVDARAIAILLDDEIISAPTVNAPILNGSAQIEGGAGGFGEDEAVTLARQIRAGALPVELLEVNSSVQSATIGIDALKMSLIGGAVGVGLILILMLVIYRIMGLAANIALLLYIPATFWVLNLLGGVLTLPGIAGVILSIGMAVDANVIIFARIREEIQQGKTVRVAVSAGFRRAMGTIIDSQVTTIIAAIVLYQFGTGPVRGFALTLIIGIILSIFTAAAVTQIYLLIAAENRLLGTNKFFGVKENNDAVIGLKKQFAFIGRRRIYYIVSLSVLVVGLGVGLIRGFNFGIDFTGGTMMQLEMNEQVDLAAVDETLRANGVTNAEIIYAGENNSQIIIRTTESLENEERAALLDALLPTFGLDDSAVLSFEQFGPSIGDLLKQNAVRAVIFASIGMLIYIIIRFEWKFGVASLIGVFHDVLILIAFYGLFHVPINNPFIAGVLTVVGYSINDTIVIFDRIRENLKVMRKSKTEPLIDTSINQTVFRSVMTALTTVLAIVPLFIFGGEVIRQFTMPLIVGIAAGAASSIFICSPIYYEICKALDKPKYKGGSGDAARPRKKPRTGDGAVV
ncbi:MAG: protein translocase subunit SecD [Clostridiales Family XIII bacterium]|jgi:SecD/SecF fusion protein|nr:protein translocase subunit SecD [Clostridiales Family XIII bacterium]